MKREQFIEVFGQRFLDVVTKHAKQKVNVFDWLSPDDYHRVGQFDNVDHTAEINQILGQQDIVVLVKSMLSKHVPYFVKLLILQYMETKPDIFDTDRYVIAMRQSMYASAGWELLQDTDYFNQPKAVRANTVSQTRMINQRVQKSALV